MASTDETIEAIEDKIEDVLEDKEVIPKPNDETVEVKPKKKYVMSPLRLEALAKAREKAFSLRKEYHANKEPTVKKKEKVKKKSKLELELENMALKYKVEGHRVVKVNKEEPVEDVEAVKPVVKEPVEEPVVEEHKPVICEKVYLKPRFVKNDNGFYCI